ncbi:hypothetical protein HKX48_002469 [Thoreauomyces humboldtii]|nr:hypothetical protein HKX48_002469 [Thoreauomyces humboldtii]
MSTDPTSDLSIALRQLNIGAEKLDHQGASNRSHATPSPVIGISAALAKDRGLYVAQDAHEHHPSESDIDVHLPKSLLSEASASPASSPASSPTFGIAQSAEPETSHEAYYYPEYNTERPQHANELYPPGLPTEPAAEDNHAAVTRSSSGTDFPSASTTPTGNHLSLPPSAYGADLFPTPASSSPATNKALGASPITPTSSRPVPKQQHFYPMMHAYPPQYYMGPGPDMMQLQGGPNSVNLSEPLSPSMSPPFGMTSPMQMYGMPIPMSMPGSVQMTGVPHHGNGDMGAGMGMGMPMGPYMQSPMPMMPQQQVIPVCRYFQQGRCWAGNNCRFQHYIGPGPYIAAYPTTSGGTAFTISGTAPPLPAPQTPHARVGNQGRTIRCRYYTQGRCWAGVACRFSHD